MLVQVSYTIEGEEPISHTFPGFSATQRVPILGLYPDTDNEVKVTIFDQAGNFASATLHGNRPATRLFSCHQTNRHLPPTGRLDFNRDRNRSGEAFMSFHHRCQRQRAMVYRAGCLYRICASPIKQKSNGNLLISFYEHI